MATNLEVLLYWSFVVDNNFDYFQNLDINS
nr:MAG TPA: hypothetical protein [Caudoviricetes sp.]